MEILSWSCSGSAPWTPSRQAERITATLLGSQLLVLAQGHYVHMCILASRKPSTASGVGRVMFLVSFRLLRLPGDFGVAIGFLFCICWAVVASRLDANVRSHHLTCGTGASAFRHAGRMNLLPTHV